MKKWTYCLLALLCPYLGWCQPKQIAYSVGDKVPQGSLQASLYAPPGGLVMYPKDGRLLILQFIASRCKSCLQDLPRLNTLQQQFGNNLQIVLVTAEEKEGVIDFYRTNPVAKANRLPIITDDSLLGSWFPHRFLSHDVWLKDGILKAITDPAYVNETNIAAVLRGDAVNWPVKTDDAAYDAQQPLLTWNIQNSEKPWAVPLYYAFVSGYMRGVPKQTSYHKDTAQGYARQSSINFSALELYLQLYKLPVNFPVSRILLHVSNPGDFSWQAATGYKAEWNETHRYCMEWQQPLQIRQQDMAESSRSILDMYFQVTSRYDSFTVPGYALVRRGGMPAVDHTDKGKHSITVSNLVYYLNHHVYGQPFVDQTGLTTNVWLPETVLGFATIKELKSQLQSFGFDLEPIEITERFLMLTQRPAP